MIKMSLCYKSNMTIHCMINTPTKHDASITKLLVNVNFMTLFMHENIIHSTSLDIFPFCTLHYNDIIYTRIRDIIWHAKSIYT